MLTNQSAKRSPNRSLRLARTSATALMIATAALLASCATNKTDRQTTSSVPDDYRTRHPITLAEVQHGLDIPIGSGEHGLTPATRDLIRGFVQEYASLSKSTLSIAVPTNAPNSGAAHAVRMRVRQVLIDAGIPAQRIILTAYDPQAGDASAPIKLQFIAVTAMTDECGQWPSDMVMGPTMVENKNWENFGCASQQNLAAQIANPTDLVGPRGMTPIDATNRANVIQLYRDGDTSSSSN